MESQDDQPCKSDKTVYIGFYNMSEDFSDLYKSSDLFDIEIKIGKNSIKAHKIILAARNEVLRKMFVHNMEENKKNILEITDFDFETFEAFIKYLYSGKITKNELTTSMLVLADKYLVKQLKQFCEEALIKNIDVNNATEYLLVSVATCAETLKSFASEFLAHNFVSIKNTANFQDIYSNKEAILTLFSQFSKFIPSTFFIISIIRELLFLYFIQPLAFNYLF